MTDLRSAMTAQDKLKQMTAGQPGVGAIGISRRQEGHALVVYRSPGAVGQLSLPDQVDGVKVIQLDAPGQIRALAAGV